MATTYTLDADNTLHVVSDNGLNADGTHAIFSLAIQQAQIPLHCRDPQFKAALPAPVLNALTAQKVI